MTSPLSAATLRMRTSQRGSPWRRSSFKQRAGQGFSDWSVSLLTSLFIHSTTSIDRHLKVKSKLKCDLNCIKEQLPPPPTPCRIKQEIKMNVPKVCETRSRAHNTYELTFIVLYIQLSHRFIYTKLNSQLTTCHICSPHSLKHRYRNYSHTGSRRRGSSSRPLTLRSTDQQEKQGDSRKVHLQSADVHFWETSSNVGSETESSQSGHVG